MPLTGAAGLATRRPLSSRDGPATTLSATRAATEERPVDARRNKAALAASCRRGRRRGPGLRFALGIAACRADRVRHAWSFGDGIARDDGTAPGPRPVRAHRLRARVPGGAASLGPARDRSRSSSTWRFAPATRPHWQDSSVRSRPRVLAEFRRYLRPGAFGARFGATAATVRTTTTALRRLGLEVGPLCRQPPPDQGLRDGRDRRARLCHDDRALSPRVRGDRVREPVRAADPAALAGGIQAVVGLSDLAPSYPVGLARPGPALPCACARSLGRATTAPAPRSHARQRPPSLPASGAYTADQIASAYGFTGL